MAIKQKVIRTYPPSWTVTTEHLEKELSNGWRVKMRTIIQRENGETIIEYILEKDE